MNERIRAPQVRVVDENGAQVGVMSSRDALALAQGKELDLIEVAPEANPPVCRIMDYGKYKFAQAKKDKDQHKKQKMIEVKILRLRPNIFEHDLEYRLKQIRGFIAQGDKVRLSLMFKSREASHPEIGRRVLTTLGERASDVAVIESQPRLEGRIMSMLLAPKAAVAPTPPPKPPKTPRPATTPPPAAAAPTTEAPAETPAQSPPDK